jgi:hypothetical protein
MSGKKTHDQQIRMLERKPDVPYRRPSDVVGTSTGSAGTTHPAKSARREATSDLGTKPAVIEKKQ